MVEGPEYKATLGIVLRFHEEYGCEGPTETARGSGGGVVEIFLHRRCALGRDNPPDEGHRVDSNEPAILESNEFIAGTPTGLQLLLADSPRLADDKDPYCRDDVRD
jgi:hypothetical protein